MLETTSLSYKRRSVRRAVSLECEIESNLWDGQVPYRVTDLSEDGLWLRTGLPIECGEQVLVSFAPPRWPNARPLVAMASVVRVAMSRRRSDNEQCGMGLRLLDLDPQERALLRTSLRGLPPPLKNDPVLEVPALHMLDESAIARPMTYILSREPLLVMPDGSEITFVAEGGLLTGGRAVDKKRLHVRATETVRTPDVTTLRLAS